MTTSVVRAPFDDIRALVETVPGPETASVEAVRQRDAVLTKPAGSLGRLEEIVEWLAAWQRRSPPKVEMPRVAVFAANHGVTVRGVSAFPQEVTAQMVANFTAGGAAINQMCAAQDMSLRVYELALDHPTPDIVVEDAFDERGCAATIAYGMEAVDGDIDLLCIGEMGIGNTTIASAIAHGLYGGEAADWVGPGTGVTGAGMQAKHAAVEAAIARIRADGTNDPLEVLRRVGGREIAAMAGAILAGRHRNVPVVIDGFVAQGGRGEDEGAQDLPQYPALTGEFTIAADSVTFTPMIDADLYAATVGHVNGMPAAMSADGTEVWPIHCPGTVAMARGNEPDSGDVEFYIVIGHGPRHLDRIMSVFGRVIDGMAHVQALRRGDPAVNSGVIADPAARDTILSMRVAADLPEAEQPRYEIMRSEGEAFHAAKDARRNRTHEFFFETPPAVIEACHMPAPVRRVEPAE